MDKQTNVLTNTQSLIPVNTRTIGAPEGIYILYLEDYVHTFIKKILSKNLQNESVRSQNGNKEYPKEYQIERTSQQEIALYGRSIEENGRYRIVISGAGVLNDGFDKIQQLNNTYFPTCSYIGNACVSLNKDSRLRIELTLRNTRVILDDFYIYYDQNEEMQNYLVEWNTTRENETGKVVFSPTEHENHTRNSVSDAAQLSRITQAYNREEAKVSFMWNVMNALCLGFVVCVMAYGIISMNNYNKMQSMQANIEYCMAFIEENTSHLLSTVKTDPDQDRSMPVTAMQQNVQVENETTKQNESPEKMPSADASQEEPQSVVVTDDPVQEPSAEQAPEQAEIPPGTAQDMTQVSVSPDELQSVQGEATQSDTAQPGQEQTPIPQYYVVRKGDTLRTICYDIYGDYSRVDEICRWNNIDDPNNILYGQKLLLP